MNLKLGEGGEEKMGEIYSRDPPTFYISLPAGHGAKVHEAVGV